MSRYTVRGREPRYRIAIGWDPTLASLFAQVEDLAYESGGAVIDEDACIGDTPQEGLLVWIGAAEPVHDVRQIEAAVAAYGTIPEELLAQLRKDQEEKRPPRLTTVPPEIMRWAGRRYRKRSRKHTKHTRKS